MLTKLKQLVIYTLIFFVYLFIYLYKLTGKCIRYTSVCPTTSSWRLYISGSVIKNHIYARKLLPLVACPVCAWLDGHFCGRWTGHREPLWLPTQIPDLTPCGLLLWSWAKEYVYRQKTRTQDEVEQQVLDSSRCLSWLLKEKSFTLGRSVWIC